MDIKEIQDLVDEVLTSGEKWTNPAREMLEKLDKSGLVETVAILIQSFFLTLKPLGVLLRKAADGLRAAETDRMIDTYNKFAAASIPEAVIVELMKSDSYREKYMIATLEAKLREILGGKTKRVEITREEFKRRFADMVMTHGMRGNLS